MKDGLYVVEIIVVMDWRVAFFGCEVFFIIHCARSSELSPPLHVKVESSVLTWDHPKNHTDVTYAVQYNTTLNDWLDVCSGPQQQFNFSTTAEDFYGKSFRVRSVKENRKSAWVQSKLVQCAHLHTCAPVMELKVKTDKVHLWMKHRDQSLLDKEGEHIIFQPLYWKRNSADKEEPNVSSTHLVLEDLESGQEYCFQVEYLHFFKPYGMPSHVVCEVIPKTSTEKKLYVILAGVLTAVGLTILGSCLYFVCMHYKSIKALLQPPLDIPEHFEEFFFSEIPLHPLACPANQVEESFELIHSVDEVADENNRLET